MTRHTTRHGINTTSKEFQAIKAQAVKWVKQQAKNNA